MQKKDSTIRLCLLETQNNWTPKLIQNMKLVLKDQTSYEQYLHWICPKSLVEIIDKQKYIHLFTFRHELIQGVRRSAILLSLVISVSNILVIVTLV